MQLDVELEHSKRVDVELGSNECVGLGSSVVLVCSSERELLLVGVELGSNVVLGSKRVELGSTEVLELGSKPVPELGSTEVLGLGSTEVLGLGSTEVLEHSS